MTTNDVHLLGIWLGGDWKACCDIAERLTDDTLLRLGAKTLRAPLAIVEYPDELLRIIDAASCRPLGAVDHCLFDNLRAKTLLFESKGASPSDLVYAALFVGENMARVLYNRASPEDPFDSDSKVWLVKCLAHFANVLPPASKNTVLDDMSQLIRDGN